jgi:hypothetical protein
MPLQQVYQLIYILPVIIKRLLARQMEFLNLVKCPSVFHLQRIKKLPFQL